MQNAEQFELLKGLQDSDPNVRSASLHRLRTLEQTTAIKTTDLLDLLQEDQPLSWQIYSVGALARRNEKKTYAVLQQFFLRTEHLILLQFLLDAFCEIADSDFLPAVLEKVKKMDPNNLPKADKKKKLMFEFDREQILLGTLKYLRMAANDTAVDLLNELLKHKLPNIRWHALMVFIDKELPLNPRILQKIARKDPEPMNQEQAQILLKQKFSQ